MDLCFKRYADPFSFMDGMIVSGRFSEFVVSLVKTVNKEREEKNRWEFWLHKVWDDGSFDDFCNKIETDQKNQNMSAGAIETTITNSLDILKNFNPPPNEGGE